MDRLQIAVCKVCCHFAQSDLLFNRSLRHVLPDRLHRQPDQVVHANVSELDRFGLVLLRFDHEERDAQQNGSKFLDRLDKLAGRRQLVARLQSLNEIVELEADSWKAVLGSGVLPVALRIRLKRRKERKAGEGRGRPRVVGHEELLVSLEVDDADLIVKKSAGRFEASGHDVIDRQVRVVGPDLRLAGAFGGSDEVGFISGFVHGSGGRTRAFHIGRKFEVIVHIPS